MGEQHSRRILIGSLIALGLFVAPAAAEQNFSYEPNPLTAANGGKLNIVALSVTYPDGSLEGSLDTFTARYVREKSPPDQKAEFDAFAASRPSPSDITAERFSEFLATRAMQTDIIKSDGVGRPLVLTVDVEKVAVPSAVGLAFSASFGGGPPHTDLRFSLKDAETDVLFASGRVKRCSAINYHADNAKRRHKLQFNWSGTDTQFRIMAGVTEALSGCIDTAVRGASFPVGRSQVGTAYTGSPLFLSIPITVGAPTFEFELAKPAPASAASEGQAPSETPTAPAPQ